MHLFFSTPVWTSKIDNYSRINKEICEYIFDLKNNNPTGIIKSNVMGWHSPDFDLKEIKTKNFIISVKDKINIALKDMNWNLENQVVKIPSLWAIINEKGALNQRHHHGNSDLSAAYYVKAPKNCGEIVFYDPRPAPVFRHPEANGPNILNATVNSVKPEEGLLVLFPSYLEHSVNPNLSNNQRIVISFNINIIKK